MAGDNIENPYREGTGGIPGLLLKMGRSKSRMCLICILLVAAVLCFLQYGHIDVNINVVDDGLKRSSANLRSPSIIDENNLKTKDVVTPPVETIEESEVSEGQYGEETERPHEQEGMSQVQEEEASAEATRKKTEAIRLAEEMEWVKVQQQLESEKKKEKETHERSWASGVNETNSFIGNATLDAEMFLELVQRSAFRLQGGVNCDVDSHNHVQSWFNSHAIGESKEGNVFAFVPMRAKGLKVSSAAGGGLEAAVRILKDQLRAIRGLNHSFPPSLIPSAAVVENVWTPISLDHAAHPTNDDDKDGESATHDDDKDDESATDNDDDDAPVIDDNKMSEPLAGVAFPCVLRLTTPLPEPPQVLKRYVIPNAFTAFFVLKSTWYSTDIKELRSQRVPGQQFFGHYPSGQFLFSDGKPAFVTNGMEFVIPAAAKSRLSPSQSPSDGEHDSLLPYEDKWILLGYRVTNKGEVQLSVHGGPFEDTIVTPASYSKRVRSAVGTDLFSLLGYTQRPQLEVFSKDSVLSLGGVTDQCGFVGSIAEVLLFEESLQDEEVFPLLRVLADRYDLPTINQPMPTLRDTQHVEKVVVSTAVPTKTLKLPPGIMPHNPHALPANETVVDVDNAEQTLSGKSSGNRVSAVPEPPANVVAEGTKVVEGTKANACLGSLDPFANESIERFKPPKGAPFPVISDWNEQKDDVLGSINKMTIGGAPLRQLIKTEVAKLKKIRFELFCEYV